MSYILDALKKADRERNLAKVPTLTTVHIPVYMTRPRMAVWAVVAILLSGGVFVWVRPEWLPRMSSTRVGAPTTVGIAAPQGEPPSRPVSPSAVPRSSQPPVASAERPVSRTGVSPPQNADRKPAGETMAGSQAGPPVSAPKASRPPVDMHRAEMRPPEPAPTPASARPEPPPQAEARPPQVDQVTVARPAAPPTTLRDALPGLTLDVFVYTDVEADRMAVINGRRYVKGQSVDGLYVVEAITPEGVVLSYQGEQALLRP